MIAVLLLIIHSPKALTYGYDPGSDQAACGKPDRGARMHQPPCDVSREGYCVIAGTHYPWHAVRRFVRENHGLMRRMYGDQRHLQVLRAELVDEDGFNDLHGEFDHHRDYHESDFKSRYFGEYTNEVERRDEEEQRLRDGTEKNQNSARLLPNDIKLGEILNTKFVFADEITFKAKLNAYNNQKPSSTTVQPETTPTEDMNETTTVELETTTPSMITTSEEIETVDVLVETSTTEDATTEFVAFTENSTEEIATEVPQKKETETVGEVLFQDVEEPPKKNQQQFDYKLKGVNACPVKEEVVAPFWANNTRGEVLALLNLYPFEQYVHWEKCAYENRQMYCREGCRCEQQYRLHRLLAYDPRNECRGIFSDWFRFPSCCVCKCYNIPADFRITSRSPRRREEEDEDRENEVAGLPEWIKQRNGGHYDEQ